MADCSTVKECIEAERLGFDIISTTLFGYTSYSENFDGPDFEGLRKIVEATNKPVIAEGKINTPEDLKKVFECAVFSAVVGSAITRPQLITKKFADVLK